MRSNKVFLKACEYMLSLIVYGEIAEQGRCAPLTEISQKLSISYPTVSKAVSYLKTKDILSSVPGQSCMVKIGGKKKAGLLLVKFQKQLVLLSELHQPFDRIKDLIKDDILNGRYRPDVPLPTYKELMVRYKTSPQTLKHALNVLCKESVLAPYKKTFTVPSIKISSRNVRLGFILPAGDRYNRLQIAGLSEELLRVFEAECSRANIGTDIYTYSYDTNSKGAHADRQIHFHEGNGKVCNLKTDNMVLGYIYAAMAPRPSPEIIVSRLSTTRKPVAILDFIGGWELSDQSKTTNLQIFHTTVSPFCGRAVGNHLLEKGHKNVAYISPFHQGVWSKNRLQGLLSAFSSQGIKNGVQPFYFSRPSEIIGYYTKRAHTESKYQEIMDFYAKWKLSQNDTYVREIDPIFTELIPYQILQYASLRKEVENLFAEALNNKRIGAWVCANDTVALWALLYLKARNIKNPEEIAVIGFDDTKEALEKRLTSFNFNIPSAVHAMVDFVIRKESGFSKRMKQPIEIKGMVVERESA